MSNVIEKVCEEKHKAIDSKLEAITIDLQANNERIGKVEDAVIMLTNMVESIEKRDFFDKILILSVFIISIVLIAIVLGPEITGRIIGNIK